MYILDTHSLGIRHLKPKQWTCVFIWNSNGKMPANPEGPPQPVAIEPPPGLLPVDGQPPPHNDVRMDPDLDMPGPPLVPDDDHPDEQDNQPPDDPKPPPDPPGFPPDNTQPPGFDTGSQPPDHPTPSPHTPPPGPYPPGPPQQGSQVPPTPLPHKPTPSFTPPSTTLPLQPLPANAFVPTLVVPPTVTDTPMHHSIKREPSLPVSSPPKKAKLLLLGIK